MGLLETVKRRVNEGCRVKKGGLNKEGCKVVMTGAPSPRLVVDFDRPRLPLAAAETRCDYLLVAEGKSALDWVAVLELKRGRLRSNEVVKQLKAGASVAERFVPQGAICRFRSIAVSGSASKHERRKLRKGSNFIRFHRHSEPVRLISCGAKLTDALVK